VDAIPPHLRARLDVILARHANNLATLTLIIRDRNARACAPDVLRERIEALRLEVRRLSRDWERFRADALALEDKGKIAKDSFRGLEIPDTLPEEL
jgi:hypothetical protein